MTKPIFDHDRHLKRIVSMLTKLIARADIVAEQQLRTMPKSIKSTAMLSTRYEYEGKAKTSGCTRVADQGEIKWSITTGHLGDP